MPSSDASFADLLDRLQTIAAELKVVVDRNTKIEQDIARLHREKAELDSRRYRACLQLEEVRRAIMHVTAPANEIIETGELVKVPIWRGAARVLREQQRPMRAPELLVELRNLGYEFETPNAREVVRGVLSKKCSVFQKLDDGRFALRHDWAGDVDDDAGGGEQARYVQH